MRRRNVSVSWKKNSCGGVVVKTAVETFAWIYDGKVNRETQDRRFFDLKVSNSRLAGLFVELVIRSSLLAKYFIEFRSFCCTPFAEKFVQPRYRENSFSRACSEFSTHFSLHRAKRMNNLFPLIAILCTLHDVTTKDKLVSGRWELDLQSRDYNHSCLQSTVRR